MEEFPLGSQSSEVTSMWEGAHVILVRVYTGYGI